MKFMVAPTYQSWQVDKVDEDAHKVHVFTKCWKCGGSGQYAWFGPCFACNGSGYHSKWVKGYTEDEYEKYIAAQEKAKVKRVEKAIAKQEDLKANSEVNKKALLEKFGFDTENPMVWVVTGRNSYAVKDELKELGCKFNPSLGWWATQPKDIPVNYGMVGIPFDDIYDWNPLTKRIDLKEDAKKVADAAKAQSEPSSLSEFVGDIKERMRDIEVTLTDARAVSSAYGTSIMFTFKQGENILVWFTSCPPDDEDAVIGHKYLLTGTVKDHKVYEGVKQTYLNRCKLTEIAF